MRRRILEVISKIVVVVSDINIIYETFYVYMSVGFSAVCSRPFSYTILQQIAMNPSKETALWLFVYFLFDSAARILT